MSDDVCRLKLAFIIKNIRVYALSVRKSPFSENSVIKGREKDTVKGETDSWGHSGYAKRRCS